jgi:peptidoglycan/LPS O-acetylase OafA/YrhL
MYTSKHLTQSPRNLALDAWRGLAALGVLGAHLSDSLATFYPDSMFQHGGGLEKILLHGQIGVDIFFLISGYIVFLSSLKLQSKKTEIKNFLFKRAIRIYAPYLPIAILLGLAYSFLPGLSRSEMPRVVNWMKSLTLFPFAGDYSLSVAWTLTYELFFYSLVALSISFASIPGRLAAVAAPSLTALVYALVANSFGKADTNSFWGLLVSAYNLEFFMGCILAYVSFRLFSMPSSGPESGSGCLFQQRMPQIIYLAAVSFMLMPLTPNFLYRLFLLTLVGFTILPPFTNSISKLGFSKLLATLGLFSYSLYLVHNPVQSLLVRASIRLGLPPLASALILVFLPVIFAMSYYSLLESKSIYLIKKTNLNLNSRP